MNTLTQQLLHFRAAPNGTEYILELSKAYSVHKIILELELMLQSDEHHITEALFFLRQISLQARDQESFNILVTRFRKEIADSRIFSLMEKLLYSPNERIRSSTIYAFGKMSFPEQQTALKNAFDFYRHNFPLQVGELLFEYGWLRGATDIVLLRDLAQDDNPQLKKGIQWFLDHISDQEKAAISKELSSAFFS